MDSDVYDDLSKISIEKPNPSVKKKQVLPDLINFDAPSTSKFDDYHTMPRRSSNSDTVSLTSTIYSSSTCNLSTDRQSSSHSRSLAHSHQDLESKTKTEDSYVFEAGYMLNLAARCEENEDYQRAMEYYKSGIEKMLIGVRSK